MGIEAIDLDLLQLALLPVDIQRVHDFLLDFHGVIALSQLYFLQRGSKPKVEGFFLGCSALLLEESLLKKRQSLIKIHPRVEGKLFSFVFHFFNLQQDVFEES